MKPEQIIKACKEKDWNVLLRTLNATYQKPYKVLASAIIDAHHHDDAFRQEFGLQRWNAWLDTQTTLLRGAFRMNLRDFHLAADLATTTLRDFQAARKISIYIIEHKHKLYGIFESMPENEEKELLGDFADQIRGIKLKQD